MINTFLFSNPFDFLESKLNFDLIFLDIEMPGINGMEVAQKVRKKEYGSCYCLYHQRSSICYRRIFSRCFRLCFKASKRKSAHGEARKIFGCS